MALGCPLPWNKAWGNWCRLSGCSSVLDSSVTAWQGTYLLLPPRVCTAWPCRASAGQPLLEQLKSHVVMGSFWAGVFADTSWFLHYGDFLGTVLILVELRCLYTNHETTMFVDETWEFGLVMRSKALARKLKWNFFWTCAAQVSWHSKHLNLSISAVVHVSPQVQSSVSSITSNPHLCYCLQFCATRLICNPCFSWVDV